VRKATQRQVQVALELIGPMGDMIESLHEIIVAHHPTGVVADDCPVCQRFAEQMGANLERWADVRAKVVEHWPV
jgi:hypothetical protein